MLAWLRVAPRWYVWRCSHGERWRSSRYGTELQCGVGTGQRSFCPLAASSLVHACRLCGWLQKEDLRTEGYVRRVNRARDE